MVPLSLTHNPSRLLTCPLVIRILNLVALVTECTGQHRTQRLKFSVSYSTFDLCVCVLLLVVHVLIYLKK